MPRQLSLYTNMRGLVREQCPSFHQWLDLELLRPNDKGLFFFREVGENISLGVRTTRSTKLPETRMEQPVELGNAAPNCRLMQRDFKLLQFREQLLLDHLQLPPRNDLLRVGGPSSASSSIRVMVESRSACITRASMGLGYPSVVAFSRTPLALAKLLQASGGGATEQIGCILARDGMK